MDRRDHVRLLCGAAASLVLGCRGSVGGEEERPPGKLRLVFKHQPMWGDPAPLREMLASFERDDPDVDVATELLPSSSEVSHQYFLTALEGGARDFDVFVVDVVWVPELARAGWIADLSSAFPPETLRREFLPGPADAVIVDGKTFAVPWFVDVGCLYYRTDLVPRAPETYADLEAFAAEARRRNPDLAGWVWQARQYEGLVCNAYEAIWGHGGDTMRGGRLVLDAPEARAALTWLRGTIERGVSPRSVTSQGEEEARRVFQDGRAVFMRNWPYAWAEAQRAGSPVRGKVGLVAVPTLSGVPGHGALGGFQLAINAHSPAYKRGAAQRLVAHMTSHEANVALALAYARNPPRRAPYSDPRILERAPAIAGLLPLVERARPRPVSPYYPMISDVLQGELSAIVSGIRPAAEALRRAQSLVDHLMQVGG